MPLERHRRVATPRPEQPGGQQDGGRELAEKDKLKDGLARFQHLDQRIRKNRHHVAQHQIEDADPDCIHTASRFRVEKGSSGAVIQ